MADWLSKEMSRDGHAVALLSGDLNIDQRLAILDRFREGFQKVLITTNLLSRGKNYIFILINYEYIPKYILNNTNYLKVLMLNKSH